ncbi:MAG: leucine-rich repeat domain-containing protein, partial [Ruminococcus sp.]|nr:leucine-rich repeat domain-containing protein [Ruminococcus sp.]
MGGILGLIGSWIKKAKFVFNSNIKSVELPETLTDICEDAFNGCKNLTYISLPGHLTNIEDRAFKD